MCLSHRYVYVSSTSQSVGSGGHLYVYTEIYRCSKCGHTKTVRKVGK